MCAKSWRKILNDFSVSPQVIAEMLQGEFAARSENEQAARVSQVLGCSPNTARAMLRGEGAGREYYLAIVAVCGWDRFFRAVQRWRRAA